ncbi:hypothetical protein AVL50_16995 [Flammeovirga sp. SJP92]|nr:hypothetical protein AVL50_16995 [Flammeovirga sp. SJP92]
MPLQPVKSIEMKQRNLWLQFTVALHLLLLIFSCNNRVTEISATVETTTENQLSNQRVSSLSMHHYVEELDIVLGDVKQGQIHNGIKTTQEVDAILGGFKEMGVGGIRIAIFADNVNPNPVIYDYLYTQAKAAGFKIFANPAKWEGGKRIANGILDDEEGGAGPSVLGKTAAKNALVSRIKAFTQQYQVDWVCPFNEDGRPGAFWYANQMDNIFSELHASDLNGATLIGPCTWGIEAGILVLDNTNIKDYISIATTHNLGFQHSLWPTFIASAGNLTVWDSETNQNKKFSNLDVRIDAAIKNGVDGLVIYDSFKGINWKSNASTLTVEGVDMNSGQDYKNWITQYYLIQNKETTDRIKPYENGIDNSLIVEVPNSWNGENSQWELIPVEGEWFRLRNRGSGVYMRPETNDDYANIRAKTNFTGLALHTQWRFIDVDGTHVFIENRGSGKRLKARNYDDISTTNDVDLIKINQVPDTWTGDWSQWSLIKAN